MHGILAAFAVGLLLLDSLGEGIVLHGTEGGIGHRHLVGLSAGFHRALAGFKGLVDPVAVEFGILVCPRCGGSQLGVGGIGNVAETHLCHHPTGDVGFLLARSSNFLLADGLLLIEIVLLLAGGIAVSDLYARIHSELAEEATGSCSGSGIE